MTETRFYYMKDGKQFGPVSFPELQKLAAANQLGRQDQVCQEGSPKWAPAEQITGLFPPASDPAADQFAREITAGVARGIAEGLVDRALRKHRQQSQVNLLKMVAATGRWLTTTIAGVSALAFLGCLFLCCGGLGMIFSLTETETAPTTIAVAELEKSSQPPSRKWLAITDGTVVWPATVEDVRKRKGQDIEDATTQWYYVPLVSKAVEKDWLETWAGSGTKAKIPYDKARVVLKISPAQMKKDFPEAVDLKKVKVLSKDKSPVKGTVGKFHSIPTYVREGMGEYATKLDADRMILIHYNDEIPSTAVGIGVGICLWLFAVPFFIPLGIFLIRRLTAKKPAAATPVKS